MPYGYPVAEGYKCKSTPSTSPVFKAGILKAPLPTPKSSPMITGLSRRAPSACSSPTPSTKKRRVRFLSEDQSSYIYTDGSQRKADLPLPEYSVYTPSPRSQTSSCPSSSRAPSLTNSSDGEMDTLECPPTPLLTSPHFQPTNEPSLFDDNAPVYAAYAAIDLLADELYWVSESFQYPTDLDFGPAPLIANTVPPALKLTEKNKPLIEQIQRLEKLRNKLMDIPCYGFNELREARGVVNAQIERCLDHLRAFQSNVWDLVGSRTRFHSLDMC
ncbi:hypothetical protein CTheo_3822 [Ceratobasidium theobromae]|uniref:Uncharacterized protein n=1 Tax=Ceratobasidium theobromae TaxID=1582974 RepID=A0A5N5QM47_9AGAM|nr:hypothetical protein CTheo_3822 [Ceratobasidium theobromae]